MKRNFLFFRGRQHKWLYRLKKSKLFRRWSKFWSKRSFIFISNDGYQKNDIKNTLQLQKKFPTFSFLYLRESQGILSLIIFNRHTSQVNNDNPSVQHTAQFHFHSVQNIPQFKLPLRSTQPWVQHTPEFNTAFSLTHPSVQHTPHFTPKTVSMLIWGCVELRRLWHWG